MTVFRCGDCGISWPPHKDYRKCPACEQRTVERVKGTALPLNEARTLARKAEFERYYAKHDAARKGPTPDEIGKAEARSIIELERAYGERETSVASLEDG
jgi:hypothetical protein